MNWYSPATSPLTPCLTLEFKPGILGGSAARRSLSGSEVLVTLLFEPLQSLHCSCLVTDHLSCWRAGVLSLCGLVQRGAVLWGHGT